jgi:hypothetical protein
VATTDKDKKDVVVGKVVDRATGEAVDAPQATDVYVPEPARVFAVEGNDVRGYIGVDAEYMTYADNSGAPLMTEQEEADYNERQRKLAVGAGVLEPDDDDIVLTEEGAAVRYGDLRADEKNDAATPAAETSATPVKSAPTKQAAPKSESK